jgi:hypothetical protein
VGERRRCGTDRGGEFIKPLTSRTGAWIAREPTAPYSPQSSGVAERLNRTRSARYACRSRDERGFSTLGSAIELANTSATGVLLWVRLRVLLGKLHG